MQGVECGLPHLWKQSGEALQTIFLAPDIVSWCRKSGTFPEEINSVRLLPGQL